jgi:hypothetical protein
MIHLRLAVAFAIMGYIFTNRTWLLWLNTLAPEIAILVKHFVIFCLIFLLDYIDPSIKLQYQRQALGALFIYMAFVIIFDYQSEWIKEVGASNVGDHQTIDGVLYHRSREILNLDPELARILVFTVAPFTLVFLGSQLVRTGQKINVE